MSRHNNKHNRNKWQNQNRQKGREDFVGEGERQVVEPVDVAEEELAAEAVVIAEMETETMKAADVEELKEDAPEETTSLLEKVSNKVSSVIEEVSNRKPEIQNRSKTLGKFKVTSVRAHVFSEANLESRPITAVVRGNLLVMFSEVDKFIEVEVLNRNREKVHGFIELQRGHKV